MLTACGHDCFIGCVLIQVSQDGFMLRLTYVLLGCDLPIQLPLKSLSSVYDERIGRSFSPCTAADVHRFKN